TMTLTLIHLRRAAVLLAASASLMLGGCGAMLAQNPSSQLKPVNAVADGTAEHLMLRGHDVVSYFTKGTHQQGTNLQQSVYQGVTFRFASAEHKALFDKDPARYAPQYGGFCANGIVYGIPWGGDADSFMMINGKLYMFGGQGSRDGWNIDPVKNLALAEKYWKEEVSNSNSFWQRWKRLVFRVPHYLNGSQLAQAVAEAKAKKP
ncbi:MAG: YHS domain-containing (seleno)protein, partial [Burkholderiales bacterium]